MGGIETSAWDRLLEALRPVLIAHADALAELAGAPRLSMDEREIELRSRLFQAITPAHLDLCDRVARDDPEHREAARGVVRLLHNTYKGIVGHHLDRRVDLPADAAVLRAAAVRWADGQLHEIPDF